MPIIPGYYMPMTGCCMPMTGYYCIGIMPIPIGCCIIIPGYW